VDLRIPGAVRRSIRVEWSSFSPSIFLFIRFSG
jgi:hypothetical protein